MWMKRTFDEDDFVIALLLALFRLANHAEYLEPPPARMSSGTGTFNAADWDDPIQD